MLVLTVRVAKVVRKGVDKDRQFLVSEDPVTCKPQLWKYLASVYYVFGFISGKKECVHVHPRVTHNVSFLHGRRRSY